MLQSVEELLDSEEQIMDLLFKIIPKKVVKELVRN